MSFRLYEGEILGITGLVGAGRSEVLQSVFGLINGTAASSGSMGNSFCQKYAGCHQKWHGPGFGRQKTTGDPLKAFR